MDVVVEEKDENARVTERLGMQVVRLIDATTALNAALQVVADAFRASNADEAAAAGYMEIWLLDQLRR